MTGELLHEADSDLHRFTKSLFFPMLLLLNFAVFQYLVLLFHVRYREKRVLLLLLTSCVSVATLVPYAMQDEDTTARLNDVSESRHSWAPSTSKVPTPMCPGH
uniref:Uncharacterized protein n=1 Tax=Globisporangium ultimum (strain ATCC 200006 / CBS 805.95 / DAOM BR144) TaxID=431595 RepID=K3WY32_GLOUD